MTRGPRSFSSIPDSSVPVMKRSACSFLLALSVCSACSSGGGGGGGGDPIDALASVGLAPKDLADVAATTMITGLAWATSDTVIPRGGCPTISAGPDDDSSGHPDSITVTFDCADPNEGLVVMGTLGIGEYADPDDFLTDLSGTCATDLNVAGMGLPSWGMSGSFFLNAQEPSSPVFTVQGGIHFAEFPAANTIVIELFLTFVPYPSEAAEDLNIQTNICATLPADDTTDIPAGYIDTFFFSTNPKDPPGAFATLECVLLGNGTVDFDIFDAADGLLASGIIDLAAGDENEVVFD